MYQNKYIKFHEIIEEYLQPTGSVNVFPLANVEHRDRQGWNHHIGGEWDTTIESVQTKKAEHHCSAFQSGWQDDSRPPQILLYQ